MDEIKAKIEIHKLKIHLQMMWHRLKSAHQCIQCLEAKVESLNGGNKNLKPMTVTSGGDQY